MPPHHSLSLLHTTKTLTLTPSLLPSPCRSRRSRHPRCRPSPPLRPLLQLAGTWLPETPAMPAPLHTSSRTNCHSRASSSSSSRSHHRRSIVGKNSVIAAAPIGSRLHLLLRAFRSHNHASRSDLRLPRHREPATASPSRLLLRSCRCYHHGSTTHAREPVYVEPATRRNRGQNHRQHPRQRALATVLTPHPLPHDVNHGNHHLFRLDSPTQICSGLCTSISHENQKHHRHAPVVAVAATAPLSSLNRQQPPYQYTPAPATSTIRATPRKFWNANPPPFFRNSRGISPSAATAP